MTLDVTRIRSAYPALAEGFAQLDGAGGTQPAAVVIDAIAGAMRTAVSNRGTAHEPARRSGEIVAAARSAVADLVGGDPAGVVFGPSATALTYLVARTLARGWGPEDEVVLSRLDHDANVRPWVQTGATVRWAEIDPATGELDAAQYRELIGPRTRLVAVTAASNAVGTVPAVRQIADLAHAAGALVFVDGVHATAHRPTDVAALGADFYVTSAYKWSGPHYAAVVADPAVWEPLHPQKLIPSPAGAPDRFEFGTLSFELLAGVTAAVDHLAGLSGSGEGDRRTRLLASMAAAAEHEARLLDRLLAGLAAIDGITVLTAPADRCPTVSFRVAGQAPAETAKALGELGVCVSHGDYYAVEYFEALGLRATGGAVRVSLYHYNTDEEVERLLQGFSLIRG
ncbi:cysteine desulfurase-like protein [Paractinoplanes atraurantiacus]|uniref:Cysteine desulfurase family protein, VC1184 subfamily n=1 Tax=Paractinoplanes atraurantiacus TaxID=1036182 RepID=A0A285JY08_9ACTN|nr:cysteine desulfurase-like protein [Actinoplanes atraurantiacus]SNY64176.1 cysteine desulfurase family protein, VC1184 subfamily [Actinoplanes atraurantiacus]